MNKMNEYNNLNSDKFEGEKLKQKNEKIEVLDKGVRQP